MDDGVPESESDAGVLDSEDILAAFRARREARSLEESEASKHEVRREESEPESGAESESAPEPESEPEPESKPEPTPEPAPEPDRTPAVAPSAVAPSSAPALAVPRGSPLTALQPGMGLADRLLADATVTVRGNLLARTVAALAAVLGLFVLVLERRGARLTGQHYYVSGTDLPVAAVAWVLTALGAVAFVVFLFYPAARTLDVRLAASQQDEWKRVQDEAKMLHVLQLAGFSMLVGGLLLALLAYAVFPERQLIAGSGLGVVLAVAGAVLAGVAASRRSAVHRLYVQTLVLSRLEQTGLGVPGQGGPDARVAPVLKALDQLLGHLPESTVRSFLQSDHAQAYLELIDEAKDG